MSENVKNYPMSHVRPISHDFFKSNSLISNSTGFSPRINQLQYWPLGACKQISNKFSKFTLILPKNGEKVSKTKQLQYQFFMKICSVCVHKFDMHDGYE